jgi:hypothetical protein
MVNCSIKMENRRFNFIMGFFEILILIPMVLISLVLLAIPFAILILMFRTYDKVKKIEDTLSKEQD